MHRFLILSKCDVASCQNQRVTTPLYTCRKPYPNSCLNSAASGSAVPLLPASPVLAVLFYSAAPPLAPRLLTPRLLTPRLLTPRLLTPRLLTPRLLTPGSCQFVTVGTIFGIYRIPDSAVDNPSAEAALRPGTE